MPATAMAVATATSSLTLAWAAMLGYNTSVAGSSNILESAIEAVAEAWAEELTAFLPPTSNRWAILLLASKAAASEEWAEVLTVHIANEDSAAILGMVNELVAHFPIIIH